MEQAFTTDDFGLSGAVEQAVVDSSSMLLSAGRSLMTWDTPGGNRVMKGAEAELVESALTRLYDELRESYDEETGETFEYGVALFDRLSYPSKMALLAEVGQALLRRTKCPEITAYRQAAIATIYAVIEDSVVTEAGFADDDDDDRIMPKDYCRSRVIAALTYLEGVTPDTPGPGELHEWAILVGAMEERVLHDMDYASVEMHLDLVPEHAAELKGIMGIAEDFYTAPAPDPTEAELKKALRDLKRLSRWKPYWPEADRR